MNKIVLNEVMKGKRSGLPSASAVLALRAKKPMTMDSR